MKRFITAGAGSGKTYTVTTEVARRVKEEGLRPEQVIMTTFTNAAAQELREKAKKELINIGCQKEALQMEHALIGTVHSVAYTFLSKYWYLLGITPDVGAIDEDEMQFFRDQSLRGLLKGADKEFIYEYCERYAVEYQNGEYKSGLNYGFWKDDLCHVLDYMQWYGITDDLLDKSLNETTECIIKLLEPSQQSTDTKSLIPATITGILKAIDASKKPSRNMKAEAKFVSALNVDTMSDDELYKLADIASSRCGANDFTNAMEEKKLCSSSIADDHRRYAEIILRNAKTWRSLYRSFKDKHHLIDFNDMEEMFLKLLSMPEVKQDIQSRYSCLYVDEFQDSNPMQVRIFQYLSGLIDACYVGDKKQAIYGFRGSDTELTTAVADSITDRSTLPYSYRSVEPLVDMSNKIFTKIFDGMSDVTLKMPASNGNTDSVAEPLRIWQWPSEKDLAQQIKQFILHEHVECSDIAVLARRNADLDGLAKELRSIGVPVCREDDNIKDSRTGRLIKAIITLMITPNNLLAKAEVAFLTQKGCDLTHIIEKRLDNISSQDQQSQDYLKDIPVISRLNTLRSTIKAQSVSAILETLIIELNLYAVVNCWDNATVEETNLQVFIDLAKKYEDSATKLASPATLAGFIDYFCNQKQKGATDNGGVRLFTYHKSKGLEWKVVIMLSLKNDVGDADSIAKKCILGCHSNREQHPTPDNINPPMTISLVRNVYTRGSNSDLPTVVLNRLKKHPKWNAVCEATRQEEARLLYVGVTRARNILILASKGFDASFDLSWFRTTGLPDAKDGISEEKHQDVLGIGMPFTLEKLDKNDLLDWPERKQDYVFDIASDFSSFDNIRNMSPSKAGTTPHDLGAILNDKENRIPERISGDEQEYACLGDFIHQVFCCMDDNISVERIKALRADYGFTEKNFPQPERLYQSWEFLTENLEKKYGPSVKRIHEMPFRHLNSEGKMVSGFMDFVWETEDAYIIVDYKTDASGYSNVFKSSDEHYAGRHGDQLDCYQQALMAAGSKPVKACLIYYPVTQFLVEVKNTK